MATLCRCRAAATTRRRHLVRSLDRPRHRHPSGRQAEELARVLGAHLGGEPVGTRGFEEREGPLRALNDADLWDALHDRMATLNEVAAAAEDVPPETDIAWTG